MLFNADLLDAISAIEIHLKIQLATITDAAGNIPQTMQVIIGGNWILNFNCELVDKVYYTEDIIDEFSDIVYIPTTECKGNEGASRIWIAQHLHGLIGRNMEYVYSACNASDLRHLIEIGHFDTLFSRAYQLEYIGIVLERAIELSDFGVAEYIYKFYKKDHGHGLLLCCLKHGKIESLDWCERRGIDLVLKTNDTAAIKQFIKKLRYLDMAKRLYASNPDMFDMDFELRDLVYERTNHYYSRDIDTTRWLAEMMRLDMVAELQKPDLSHALAHASDGYDYVLLDWMISDYHNLLSALTQVQKHDVMQVLFSTDYVTDNCKAGLLAKFVDLCFTGTIHMPLFAGFSATKTSMQYLSTRDDVVEFGRDDMEFWIYDGNFAMVQLLWAADRFIADTKDRIKLIALSINHFKVDEVTWLFEHTKIKTISEMELLVSSLKEEAKMTKDLDMKRWAYDQLNLSSYQWYSEAEVSILSEKYDLWLLELASDLNVNIDFHVVPMLSETRFQKFVLHFLWNEKISILRKIRAEDMQRFNSPKLLKTMLYRSKYGYKTRLVVWLMLECGIKITNEDVIDHNVDVKYFVELQHGGTVADINNRMLRSKI